MVQAAGNRTPFKLLQFRYFAHYCCIEKWIIPCSLALNSYNLQYNIYFRYLKHGMKENTRLKYASQKQSLQY